jgi:hypothetical protein
MRLPACPLPAARLTEPDGELLRSLLERSAKQAAQHRDASPRPTHEVLPNELMHLLERQLIRLGHHHIIILLCSN